MFRNDVAGLAALLRDAKVQLSNTQVVTKGIVQGTFGQQTYRSTDLRPTEIQKSVYQMTHHTSFNNKKKKKIKIKKLINNDFFFFFESILKFFTKFLFIIKKNRQKKKTFRLS